MKNCLKNKLIECLRDKFWLFEKWQIRKVENTNHMFYLKKTKAIIERPPLALMYMVE